MVQKHKNVPIVTPVAFNLVVKKCIQVFKIVSSLKKL